MRKYFDKYKRIVVIYFVNLDIVPETKTIRRKIRQYYISKEKENLNYG